jgi:hypothetical protein
VNHQETRPESKPSLLARSSQILSIVAFLTGAGFFVASAFQSDPQTAILIGVIALATSAILLAIELGLARSRQVVRGLIDRFQVDPSKIKNETLRNLVEAELDNLRSGWRRCSHGSYRFANEIAFIEWLTDQYFDKSNMRLRAACTEKTWALEQMGDYFTAWFDAAARSADTKRLFIVRGAARKEAYDCIEKHRGRAPFAVHSWTDVSPCVQRLIRQLSSVDDTASDENFGFVMSESWVLVHWGKPKMKGWLLTGDWLVTFRSSFEDIEKQRELSEAEYRYWPRGEQPEKDVLLSQPARELDVETAPAEAVEKPASGTPNQESQP